MQPSCIHWLHVHFKERLVQSMETIKLPINCANSPRGKNDTRLNTLAYLRV